MKNSTLFKKAIAKGLKIGYYDIEYGDIDNFIWKLEPYYLCELKGSQLLVRSFSKVAKGDYLAQQLTKDGYLRIKINGSYKLVHLLIAEHYFGKKPDGLVVNHKDCNKLNNHPNNLEYVTIYENIQHSIKHGMHVSNDPKRSGRYKHGKATKENITLYKSNWQKQKRSKEKLNAK